jgi:ribosome-associated protein
VSITFAVRGEYIQLDQLLKATGLCESGGAAHAAIAEGRSRSMLRSTRENGQK